MAKAQQQNRPKERAAKPARPPARRRATTPPSPRSSLPPAPLSPEMAAYFAKCEEKLGFVPNVLQGLCLRHGRSFRRFVAMYNDLMLAPSGLSKLEREMIAVAVSVA